MHKSRLTPSIIPFNLTKPVKVTMIETIAFDADDTLWENEGLYLNAQAQLQGILSPWSSGNQIHRVLTETEFRNLPIYGYGIKAFTLSMIETALQVSQGNFDADTIQQILVLGRSMLQAEVALLPNVAETLQSLSRTHQLMIITKGDLLDQTSKVSRSGLADCFSLIEVLNEKTTTEYQEILQKYRLDARTFLMVGNSLRSDIAPVLELGGRAVLIPTGTTWEHELLDSFDNTHDGFFEIKDMADLPALIKALE